MDADALVKRFQAMPWEVWLHRRFSPFVTYLMMKHGTPASYAKQGLSGQFPIALYDTDDWYGTPEMFELGGIEAEKCFKQKDIFTLVGQCEAILARGREELPKLAASSEPARILFEKALALIEPANLYIWIAHGGEAYYLPLLRKMLAPHIPADELEKFIGDVTFPDKKNAVALMDDDIRAGAPAGDLHKKYGWIKARGGFEPGYTLEEMKEIREKTLAMPPPHHVRPEVPAGLEQLIKEAQELVYLRTLRTDALYEMYHLAQPVFERYAGELGVPSLKDYIPDELLAGNAEKVPHEYAILKDNEDVLTVRESIVSDTVAVASEVKGVVAFKGKVRGTVKVVHVASEAGKVEAGDVLVANMTNPSYVSAMHRAAAFVTNEGGITCHAAILAREMKKPCVTGTKIATKVFKDGDTVEVDAEKGIVRKL